MANVFRDDDGIPDHVDDLHAHARHTRHGYTQKTLEDKDLDLFLYCPMRKVGSGYDHGKYGSLRSSQVLFSASLQVIDHCGADRQTEAIDRHLRHTQI